MNEWFYCRVITGKLVLHTRHLKEDSLTKKPKQNAERYRVREGSPVEIQWVREEEWSRKIIPKAGWCIPEWATVMRDDERVRQGGWTEQSSGYGDTQVEQ